MNFGFASKFGIYANKCSNHKAKVLAECLDEAIGEWLENNKAPSRKVKEDDNRTSHFT